MSKKRLDIEIAGRLYPLNVENDEEQKAQEIAAEIKKDITDLDKQYTGLKDKQDILAILAFKYRENLLSLSDKFTEHFEENQLKGTSEDTLNQIELLLDATLNLSD